MFNAIKQVLQKQQRTSFLNKHLPTSVKHNEKFIYFPLGVDEEHNLLIGAPFYTNQIETIRHVAKSIPINYKLYVKEHPSSATRNWKSVSDYKEIMNIPNVRLLHHSVPQSELFQNCSLVISAMGSSCLEAAFYGKLNSVKFLIDNGCDVNIISRETTPFLDACIKGYVETAIYLLDNGADPFIEVPSPFNYYNLLKNGRIDKDIIMKVREKQDLENE